MNKVEDNKSK